MPRRSKSKMPAVPAPFTLEQVAALNAGTARRADVVRTLARHRQPRLPAKAARASAPAPIPLTAAQLKQLASGRVTPSVAAAFEAAPRRRSGSRAAARSRVRPQRTPPGAE